MAKRREKKQAQGTKKRTSIPFQLLLRPEERATLQEAAEKEGCKLGPWIRMVAMQEAKDHAQQRRNDP